MHFILANSAWLGLLALGIIPILVHFFARTRPPRYLFSDTAFLQRILKKTERVRKPQDWLILVLRTLAVLALLFAFLQPLLTSDREMMGSQKTTVFLVDRSASMMARDGTSDRFSQACQKVSELLKTDSIDRANVVWIDSHPNAVFPQPGENLSFLRDLLTRTTGRQEVGNLPGALQLAVNQLEIGQGQRELVILSDFQASAWSKFQLETPPGVKVTKVKVGEEGAANLALTALFSDPATPVIGQDVSLIVKVRNFSDTARRTTLYLELGGARQSQEVNVTAWGEAQVRFQTVFTNAGQFAMSVNMAGDQFPGDDERHFVVQVRDSLKLVSVAPSSNSRSQEGSEVLTKLAGSLDWLEHRVSEILPLPGSVDFLFLHHWKGGQVEKLKELVAGGTAIFVQPAPGVTYRDAAELFELSSSSQSAISLETEGSWEAMISEQVAPGNSIFNLFESGEYGNPVEGSFQSRFKPDLDQLAGLTRLIDYRDEVPALMQNQDGLFFWNLPLAPAVSSWAGESVFLPFMAELFLNARPSHDGEINLLLPGSRVMWMPGDALSPESLVLTDDDGEPVDFETQMTKLGLSLLSEQDASPGLYRWKVGPRIIHHQAANFPSSESDLRTIDPEQVAGGEVLNSKQLLRRASFGDGLSLWPWLIALALGLLLIESLVTLWQPKPKTSSLVNS